MSVMWIYAPNLADVSVDASLPLAADEVRHVHTRRLRAGDRVVLFDGRGRLAGAKLEKVTKKEVSVRALEGREVPRQDSGFVLASAIPKGDRLSTLLQMISQLGIERWQPLILGDSAIRKLDSGAARLQRIVIESCKVARRPHALEIESPVDLEVCLGAANGPIFYGDREGTTSGLTPEAALLVIGPEAGLTESELRQLQQAGGKPCRLSPYNLRIETAAIAGATAYHLARSSSLPNGSTGTHGESE